MAGTYSRMAPGTRIDLHHLPLQAPAAHPHPSHPLAVKNPAAYAATKARRGAAKGRSSVLTPGLAGLQGTVEEKLTVFPAMDLVQGSTLLGADQNTEPPDTQLAVGPSVVVETVNSNMSVWSKGGVRQSITDLNLFYAIPAGYGITDARILYDAQSQRFIQTAVAIDGAADSRLYIAVSRGSDASSWTGWQVKATTRTLIDQPKPGTSDDKVSISWAEAAPPPCQGQSTFFCFSGQFITVLQKSDLLAGASPRIYARSGDFYRFGIVPAQAQSSTTTQYLVYNNADPYFSVENLCGPSPDPYYGVCPTLGEMALTGTPAAGNIAITESYPPIRSTTIPADAAQQGSATTISTGDDRLVSAVWQNGRLWTSATDGNYCSAVDPPDPYALTSACLRLIQTATDAPGMPVLEDVTLGGNNDYLYYPAVSMDNAGDVFAAFSRSNAGNYAGVWVSGQPVGSGWSPLAVLKAGNGPYDTSGCSGHNRWGDYSGAANDPTDPTDVWVAGEYAMDNGNSCFWGTAIGRLTYSAPTVTSVTPATGGAAGGTAVVITGTDFVSSATTVYFGAATASGVTVQTPDQLTATTPPGMGWVRVSASTADGHGPNGPVFKYPRQEAGPGHLSSQAGATVPPTAPPEVSQSTSQTRTGPPPPPHTVTDPATLVAAGSVRLAQPLWLIVQQAILRIFQLMLAR